MLLTAEETLNFIEDYRSSECLWDINNHSYTNKVKRHKALTLLAKKYDTTEKEIKTKIKNLRSYFSKEHQKVAERNNDPEADNPYESTWFAYEAMLFLTDLVKHRSPRGPRNADFSESGIHEVTIHTTEDKEGEEKETSFEKRVGGKLVSQRRNAKRNILKRKRDCGGDDKEGEISRSLRYDMFSVERDDCTYFGQMVASELRKLNPRSKAVAKNRINNVIFESQMEEIGNTNEEQFQIFNISNEQSAE